MVGQEYERRGITKDGAKIIMVVSGASVLKITVVCNGSYGAGTYGMSGRASNPRFMFTWPQAQISAIGTKQTDGVLTDMKLRHVARDGRPVLDAETAATPPWPTTVASPAPITRRRKSGMTAYSTRLTPETHSAEPSARL